MENKITDKGWTAMRTLLDREMPEKRRRRLVWGWLGLLLVPMALYGGWDWMQPNHSSPPQQPESTHLPEVAIAPKTEFQPGIASVQKMNEADADVSNPITNAPDPGTKNTVLKPTNLKQNSAKQDFDTPFNASALPKNQMESSQSNSGKTQIPTINTVEATPQTSIVCLPIVLKSVESQTIETKNPDDFKYINHIIPVKNPFKPTWHIGSTTLVSTEQFNAVNGFATGVTADWKFSRKWGLRTGLLYNIHTPQEDHRPVTSVLADDYTARVDGNVQVFNLASGMEVISSPGINYFGDSLGSNVLIPVNRLQRLQIPISVFWQANRTLKLFGGIDVMRTLTTLADRQNYSGDYILQLTDKIAEEDASKLSASKFGKWSANAMLGIGFTLGKSFEMGFSAEMPFNKINSLKKSGNLNPTGNFITDQKNGQSNKLGTAIFALYGTLYF